MTLVAGLAAALPALPRADRLAAGLAPWPLVAARTLHLSTGLLVALGILGVVNLALMATALVSLFTRPAETVRFHRAWLWAIVVVLVSWIGPLLYFAVGRVDAPLPDESGTGDVPAAERARHAVELLYGPPEGPR